jgi:predicted short-subunit dehydrogenase-like oxidoreductase (DUF2520 family)
VPRLLPVCIVGRGKVGRALAQALARHGIAHASLRGRSLRGPVPPAELYLLAVPDAALRNVAERLAPQLAPEACALHLAGARDVDELAALSARGVAVGVFHPLVSFAHARGAASLEGASFTAFGQARATRAARRLAKQLGARCVVLPAAPGPAYHAAAALVANGAAALTHAAVRVLSELGFSPAAAELALSALLASVASNVRTVGVPAALTGPVMRGDVGTVERHLAALHALDPALREAYAALQPAIVDCAVAAGLASDVAHQLLRVAASPARRRGRPAGRGGRLP